MIVKEQLNQVQQFHEMFELDFAEIPTAQVAAGLAEMRVKLIEEELSEYCKAAKNGDIVEIADALTDLLYVVFGTIVIHGLTDLAEELFTEVHRSNMSKLDTNGRPIHREDGKVSKSPKYSRPDLISILAKK